MTVKYKQQRIRKPSLNTPDELTAAPAQHAPDSASHIRRLLANPQTLSQPNILNLQRTLGNKTTHHLMRQSAAAHVIQRALDPIGGKSSNYFGISKKGNRDVLNLKVESYNSLSEQSKHSPEDNNKLFKQLREIRKHVLKWLNKTSDKEKHDEIKTWITTFLSKEEFKIGAMVNSNLLKNKDDSMGDEANKKLYESKKQDKNFTTEEYEKIETWLFQPDLVNVFRQFGKDQISIENIDAYIEMSAYEQNPSKDEAIRIHDKYRLDKFDYLNLDGKVKPLIADFTNLKKDTKAEAPKSFGKIAYGLLFNISEMFTRFRFTDAFYRITGTKKSDEMMTEYSNE